ncbi:MULTISPECIES: hypothetical protein [Halorussus]|uniref:hypothetical protein n=1 Tax=Halorussus TaxID=1070314 RepID=UPI00209CA8A8|nr:hypothetical protein [Halorussus vallis]USZ75437.1 hypothetical protein NGM07_18635 [Halorussus vallis]
MPQASVQVGCPHCDARSVTIGDDLRTDGGEPRAAFGDGDRLKGRSVACAECGDRFEVYYY